MGKCVRGADRKHAEGCGSIHQELGNVVDCSIPTTSKYRIASVGDGLAGQLPGMLKQLGYQQFYLDSAIFQNFQRRL